MAVEESAQVRIAPGATLAGKYRLVREIGRGGVGVVYEAEHLKLRQRVAIKILSKGVCDAPLVSARFEREARAMASLRSPYVTVVSDVDVLADGSPYMVMELLEGRDLQRELRERGMLPPGEAVQIALLACRGLSAVHAAGIIHRDLKPSNLFLVKSGHEMQDLTVKVMDFGVSKVQGDDVLVTHDGSTLGTPAYMAPEQVKSARDVDVRADIWSLGVILFRTLAGTLPFEGEGITGMAVAITNNPIKSLAAIRSDLPPGLIAVVERMLSKAPEARYATIEEVAMALAAFGDAPFSEAATDPNVSLPMHVEDRLALAIDGEPVQATSHIRPTESHHELDAQVKSSSPPPRSRVLMLVLPLAMLLVLAGAALVTAASVHRDAPVALPVPPTAAPPASEMVVAPVVTVTPAASASEPSSAASSASSGPAASASASTPAVRTSPLRRAHELKPTPSAASTSLPSLL